jgi:hypothetical protein
MAGSSLKSASGAVVKFILENLLVVNKYFKLEVQRAEDPDAGEA